MAPVTNIRYDERLTIVHWQGCIFFSVAFHSNFIMVEVAQVLPLVGNHGDGGSGLGYGGAGGDGHGVGAAGEGGPSGHAGGHGHGHGGAGAGVLGGRADK